MRVTPVGKVVAVMLAEFITVGLSVPVNVGLKERDIDGDGLMLCVFVLSPVVVTVIVGFVVKEDFKLPDIVVVAVPVFELEDDAVKLTVDVEVLELLVEPVIVAECVFDFDVAALNVPDAVKEGLAEVVAV